MHQLYYAIKMQLFLFSCLFLAELVEALKLSEATGVLRIVIAKPCSLVPSALLEEETYPLDESRSKKTCEEKVKLKAPKDKEKDKVKLKVPKDKEKAPKELKVKKSKGSKTDCNKQSDMENTSVTGNGDKVFSGSEPPNWFTDHMNQVHTCTPCSNDNVVCVCVCSVMLVTRGGL